MSSILIIGAGYVGLATAVSFAHLGHEVVGVEIDRERLAGLCIGEPPFLEQGLREFLSAGLTSGRLSFAAPSEARYEEAELVFLCLPTPQGADGAADVSALYAAVDVAGPRLAPGSIMVNKSTVPVGTTRLIARRLGRSDVSVVSNPEFLQEGQAIAAFMGAERVVIGADDDMAAKRVAQLYSAIATKVIHVGIESAELAKYACNAFLATKLSFINSMAIVSELVGADIAEISEVMGSDSRIGPKFLTAGPGWGGSCFPKDMSQLSFASRKAGFDFLLVDAAIRANEQSFSHIVDSVKMACGGSLDARKIAVWGLTFKAGTDDIRSSPAIEIIHRLRACDASIVAYDPGASAVAGVTTSRDAYAACEDADALVVLTEWPEFSTYDLSRVAKMMHSPLIIDCRGIINVSDALRMGFSYHAIGRSQV